MTLFWHSIIRPQFGRLWLLAFTVCACEAAEVEPQKVPTCDVADGGLAVTGIYAQTGHTCALLSPCGAVCWGRNAYGQSGPEPPWVVPAPTWVVPFLALKDVSVAKRHSCSVSDDGGVWCWGSNDSYQLGVTFQPPFGEAVRVEGLPAPALRVAAGGDSTCALLTDGTVACWGHVAGQDPTSVISPRRIPGAERMATVANTGGHGCGVTEDGAVLCWGANYNGQLGDGTIGVGRPDARPVDHLPDAMVEVALGYEVSCANNVAGEVYCWGLGEEGVLGNGNLNDQPDPAQVSDVTEAVDLALGIHACAARLDGTLACWGNDVFLPDDGINDVVLTPVSVSGVEGAIDVAVGFYYTCALTRDQEIYCWGANDEYQLGLGYSSFVDTPTRVDWRAALP